MVDGQPVLALTGLSYHNLIGSYTQQGVELDKLSAESLCWPRDEAAVRRIAYKYWPTAAVRGELTQELPTPAHFEQAAKMVREEDVAEAIIRDPDPGRHIAGVREFKDAGDDHVYVHQVGPDQEGFFRFYEQEGLPRFR